MLLHYQEKPRSVVSRIRGVYKPLKSLVKKSLKQVLNSFSSLIIQLAWRNYGVLEKKIRGDASRFCSNSVLLFFFFSKLLEDEFHA